jgi:ABC-type nitrate/sulfonate/bicarbonate transport system permease component
VRIMRARRGTARIISLTVMVTAWWVIVPMVDTEIVPTVGKVAVFMFNEIRMESLAPATLYETFAITLGRLVIGLGMAMLVGTTVGLAMGFSARIYLALEYFVVVGLSVPSLVYALITGMWFGFGSKGPIITAFLASVTFIVMSTAEGVKSAPMSLLEMTTAFHVSRRRAIRDIILPSVLPFLFAAIRFGVASGWRGLVVSEIFAASSGAGWMIMFWYDARRVHGVVGYAIFFLVLAVVLDTIFARVSSRVFRWRPAVSDPRHRRVEALAVPTV